MAVLGSEALCAHVQELFAPIGDQITALLARQFLQSSLDCLANGLKGVFTATLSSAQGLFNNLINDTEFQEILSGEPKSGRGLAHFL